MNSLARKESVCAAVERTLQAFSNSPPVKKVLTIIFSHKKTDKTDNFL